MPRLMGGLARAGFDPRISVAARGVSLKPRGGALPWWELLFAEADKYSSRKFLLRCPIRAVSSITIPRDARRSVRDIPEKRRIYNRLVQALITKAASLHPRPKKRRKRIRPGVVRKAALDFCKTRRAEPGDARHT